MKLEQADASALTFLCSGRERPALIRILKTYPAVPPAHHIVTRETSDAPVAEYQRLLDDALAEQRNSNREHLQAWLAADGRFVRTSQGWRFKLERADSEWLLQVLNDIRVGHWLQMGSPDPEKTSPEDLTPAQLVAWLAMQMCAFLQMTILEAFGD